MGSRAASIYLSQQPPLFPAPLQIKKKTRRSAFRRLARRKSTHSRPCVTDPQGPLDDIIDEITAGIWPSLPEVPNLSSKTLLLQEDAFSWSVTPLPVSRIPSDQPLTIRKTRNSRSTASGSSTGEAFGISICTDTSEQSELFESEFLPSISQYYPSSSISHFNSSATTREPTGSYYTMNQDVATDTSNLAQSGPTAAEQLTAVLELADGSSQEMTSRPSRKRFFSISKPMEKLRLRTNTGDLDKKDLATQASFAQGKRSSSSQVSSIDPDAHTDQQVMGSGKPLDREVSMNDAVNAWLVKNARRGSVMNTFHSHVAPSFPSPLEHRGEVTAPISNVGQQASLLSTAVTILPEVKVLEGDTQNFWVTIEIEGVLHNRHTLPDTGIDVVLLLDNGYYVTKDCLDQSVDVAIGMLQDLRKGDRLALYTTHCTHEGVTGIVPDLLYPLKAVDANCMDVIREILNETRALGSQKWERPRPNPPMGEVIMAIAQSIVSKELKHGQTQVVLLSPSIKDIHKVSRSYPQLQIHQLNPAALPFHGDQELEKKLCFEECCGNVMLSNFICYQPVADRLRRILRYARSERPSNILYNVHADIRRRSGCEVIQYRGSPEIPYLRLGQVHTFFVQIKVDPSETREMDLESFDPVRDSSLIASNMKQDLLNAKAMGASKVHILSLQVMHQDSWLPATHWNFSEAPLFIFKELGKISRPTDRALDVYKRRFFYELSRLEPAASIVELEKLVAEVNPGMGEAVEKMAKLLSKEIVNHQAIIDYEFSERQNLPTCLGPIHIPPAHEFVSEKWAHRHKRMGMIVM